MKNNPLRFAIALVATSGLLLLTGCGGDSASVEGPVALGVDEAPTTLEAAFAGSTGEMKVQADDAIRLLRSEDYPMALMTLQQLAARTDLSGSQRGLTSQAILTANAKVAEAAKKGDEEAEKLQRYREFTK